MHALTPTKLRLGATSTLAAIVIMAALFLHGAAEANTQPPPQPSNPMALLIAGPDQEPQVRISWDAPDEGTVTSHKVSRNDGESFDAAGGATTYSDQAIEPGMNYSYTVTAQSDAGDSPASDPVAASVPPSPSMPGGFTGTLATLAASDETPTVTLTWTASTVPEAAACETAYPVDGYTITRTSGEDTAQVGSPGNGDTSFTDNTADFGTKYTYRIHSHSAIGASPTAEVMVAVPTRPVEPPTGLTASITDPFDGNISLSWNAPEEGPAITGYMVFRYLGEDPYEGTGTPTTLDEQATQTVLVDATVLVGVTYSYIVMARSADKFSLPSNTASIEAPAAPSGLTATAGDGAIDLSWPAPAGTTGSYRTGRQEQNGAWEDLADTTATTHSDTTAQGNTQYVYRVQHRNAHGDSAWTQSDPVTLVLVPGSPTGLTATASGNNNVLAWTAPNTPAIDGYRVRHRTGDGEWAILAGDLGEDVTGHTHRDAAADVPHH